ncbi:MAG: hemerythrin [Tenericutes bacterium GWC2_34_14]|nr:MAG: hemerythrin [Tenericutes bacterium GWC2_34_14]OHE34894.1 MAG: hemerythrin [Tenericutes bacterium GWE2_34_108]OHE37246.1 MAG: hemerythrin [Tenericutes bacterium GWF1_35_14]OHE39622.1 MAG: hemerythrin [Tenericutes bacterium GWF2_35_184]OHE44190.1 MAG: hemerythrin [Tenericutes bacterium RIFOXYA2_FULL_36_32]OHE47384.1 MAG: hemerythrin [Tenericutes bacterium RIFOXYB2_FULL_36_25]OHE49307.1 MAG: hemerythrin [Tenericutes bacterium RIFOXYC2_FULL_35_27]OHE52979.1 MAG: hemerythrin [Tenericutes 
MKSIDVRPIPPKDRHDMIFNTFFNLGVGESMMLINDHDPKPLYYQFSIEYPETFEWIYQTKGPEMYEVMIKKVSTVNPK